MGDAESWGNLVQIILVFIVIVVLVVLIFRDAARQERQKRASWSPEQRARYQALEAQRAAEAERVRTWGARSPLVVCPHCQTQGYVRTKPIKMKQGIHGGKVTAALLTGGTSLLFTGLSRKVLTTQAHCDRCGSTWRF